MIVYLIKFITCSSILLLFYYLVLQRDKLFRFNRFFLLALLIISLAIPLTTVRTKVVEVAPMAEYVTDPIITPASSTSQEPPSEFRAQEAVRRYTVSTGTLLWNLYGLGVLILLLRFGKNLQAIRKLRTGAKIIKINGLKLVLRSDIHSSFSFFGYLYTNRECHENGQLPTEIIDHEKVHIDQKHSLDIMFIELMQCILWFNPVVYFLKKAIRLNHEFLADSAVIKSRSSVYNYQKVLLDYTGRKAFNTPVFASNLNYGFTKKRIMMMTKNKNKFVSLVRQIAAVLTIAFSFWALGATETIAQEKADVKEATPPPIKAVPAVVIIPKEAQDIPPPPPPRPIKIGDETKVRFKDENGEMVVGLLKEFSDEQRKALRTGKLKGEFFLPPPPKAYLTQSMLDDFQDPNEYGVWVDGKKVANSELSKYTPADFHHFLKSRVHKSARQHKKYAYHLEMITQVAFDNDPSSKGTWRKLPVVKEIHVEDTKNQNKSGNQKPTAPTIRFGINSDQNKSADQKPAPPTIRFVINSDQKVRFKNEQGEMITKVFKDLDEKLQHQFLRGELVGEFFLPPPPRAHITQAMLNDFMDEREYGIWLDGKRIENSELKNYQPEDFHRFNKNRLKKNATHYGQYTYYLSLYTEKAFSRSAHAKGTWLTNQKVFVDSKSH